MKRVCVESPLRGDYARNIAYADACMLDALRRGEAPFLGHVMYPRVLNDVEPADRELGIAAHLAWLAAAELVALYVDYGISSGMTRAIERAQSACIPVEQRRLGPMWLERYLAGVNRTPGTI
jgi:hypothetical protein